MIRDTSSQDTVLATHPAQQLKKRLALAAAGVAVAGLAVFLLAGWRGSETSVNAERLRIAPAAMGTLVRDASVNAGWWRPSARRCLPPPPAPWC